MKIGIIGSGVVGQVLANAFVHEGHDVTLGTRDPSKPTLDEWKKANPKVQVKKFNETAASSDLIVLAVSGDAAEHAIELSGADNFKNKTVIDATNPIDKKPPVNGVLQFFTSYNESLMERLQLLVPEAKFVKALNSVGNPVMYKPDFKGITPTMFICGNDDGAKKTVTSLLDSLGWETADMGKVEAARAIEALCILWCIPGFTQNSWSHAFKLLKPQA